MDEQSSGSGLPLGLASVLGSQFTFADLPVAPNYAVSVLMRTLPELAPVEPVELVSAKRELGHTR